MKTKGRHYRYRKLEFWAERGLINIVDERFPPSHPRAFDIILVEDFKDRLRALVGTIERWKLNQWTDERKELQKMIEDGVQCVKDAVKQGRPDDPKALAEILRDRRRNMLYAGNPAGALPAGRAPESVDLPPIPKAPAHKPVTPLVPPPVPFSKLFA